MPGGDAGWRWQARFALVQIVLLAVYSSAIVALAVFGLAHGERTGEWRPLWGTLFGAIFTLCLPLFVWLRFGYPGIHARKSTRLRLMQTPADVKLLPVAADQPAALTPDELAGLPRGFVGVRIVGDAAEQAWRGSKSTFQLVISCALMLALTYVAGYASMPNLFDARIGPVPVFLIWIGCMLLLLAPTSIGPLVSSLTGQSGVHWDERGLRYRRGPLGLRSAVLPWGQILAVLHQDFNLAWSPAMRHIYPMYTPDGVFTWGYNPTRRGAAHEEGDERLLRLILTKTGLPLREPVAADVMRELPVPPIPFPGSGRLARVVASATEERLPPEAADRLRATLPAERELRRGRALVCMSFVPALLLAVLYLVGLGMQLLGR